ncbi:MAG: hypothetical protein PHV34_06090 [Verrucomicrobiae bacterium]|nr:hypothetical protein [Verrucomicrobiae bacterium]
MINKIFKPMENGWLTFLKNLTLEKRVLDIGDEDSPFVAEWLAASAKSWFVTGRYPPNPDIDLSRSCVVSNKPFDRQTLHLNQSLIDVILFSCPSPVLPHDAEALQWASPQHQIILITDAHNDRAYGSPGFWTLAEKLYSHDEYRDENCHIQLLSPHKPEKKGEAAESTSPEHKFPKRGERYRLGATCHWPGKQKGDRPPIVEIRENWRTNSGYVELLERGELIYVHLGDLGNRIWNQ